MPSTESLWVSDDNSPDPVKPDTSGAAYYQYRGVLVEKCRVIGNPTLPVYHGCEGRKTWTHYSKSFSQFAGKYSSHASFPSVH